MAAHNSTILPSLCYEGATAFDSTKRKLGAIAQNYLINVAGNARLTYRKYRPQTALEDVENKSGGYLVVLPLHHGYLRLERNNAVLHEGAVYPGVIRIVEPGERSRMRANSEFDSAVFTIREHTFCELAHHFNFPEKDASFPDLPPIMQANHDIKRLVPLLRNTFELRSAQRELMTTGLLMTILAVVLNADHHQSPKQPSGFDDEQFKNVLEFARLRLCDRLDLSDWADSLGMTTNEFARRFQQHTGIAPYTWFLDRRIEQAKLEMTETKKPLVEVALDSGFCSQAHFTEAFHRRVGVSPGRWRSSQKKAC